MEELDWWSKYYESLKEMSNQVMLSVPSIPWYLLDTTAARAVSMGGMAALENSTQDLW